MIKFKLAHWERLSCWWAITSSKKKVRSGLVKIYKPNLSQFLIFLNASFFTFIFHFGFEVRWLPQHAWQRPWLGQDKKVWHDWRYCLAYFFFVSPNFIFGIVIVLPFWVVATWIVYLTSILHRPLWHQFPAATTELDLVGPSAELCGPFFFEYSRDFFQKSSSSGLGKWVERAELEREPRLVAPLMGSHQFHGLLPLAW